MLRVWPISDGAQWLAELHGLLNGICARVQASSTEIVNAYRRLARVGWVEIFEDVQPATVLEILQRSDKNACSPCRFGIPTATAATRVPR